MTRLHRLLHETASARPAPAPFDPYRRLWAAVAQQAVDDLHDTAVNLPGPARAWFRDERMFIGSFLWVCQVLELDPGCVRRKLAPPSGLQTRR